jgi:hypothetical protein
MKQTTLLYILSAVIAFLILTIVISWIKSPDVPMSVGSTVTGQEYNATTTSYTWAAQTGGFQLIKKGSGTLGSYVVTSATAVGAISLYDATTTVNGGVYGTTTLAVIGTGAIGGTYTFDVNFSKGLIVVPSATTATGTVTWR